MKLLSVTVLTLLGAASGRAAEPVYKDMRAPGSQSSYAVAFVARGGVPGHAFIIIGYNDEAKRVCVSQAFGFYPAEGQKGVLGQVPGKLVDEYRDKTGAWKGGTYLVVRVERDAYLKIEALMRQWAAKKYQVLEADCVTFQGEVARVLGLKIPDRGSAALPTTFAEKLRDLNR